MKFDLLSTRLASIMIISHKFYVFISSCNELISHFSRYSQRTYLKLLNLEPEEKEQHVVPLKQYELEAQVLAHHWFWAVDPHSTFDSIKVHPDTLLLRQELTF